MPLMTNITLNDGSSDLVFEPAFREGSKAVFEVDGSTVDARARLTATVRPDTANLTTRKSSFVVRLPVTVSAETGEVAYVVASVEVTGDKRINNSDFGRAAALASAGAANTAIAEMIADHRFFYG